MVLALCGLVVGCLSYEQITLCSVLSWPYPVRLCCLAMDIQQHREEELAAQRRRGLAARAHTQLQPAQSQPQSQSQQS